jgi:SulP family sulfate permease
MPASVQSLRQYTRADFSADLLAGLTVGSVALPLAMVFAIAAGLPPQSGLYTAIVAGFLISALGGCRMQIGGPTGAFVVIIASILARYGVSGLALVTLMAGCILIVMGLTGLGAAVQYIPRPVTVGFTNGIAILIASTQIKEFLGLRMGATPSAFLSRMAAIAHGLPTIALPALALSLATLAILLLLPRWTRRIPGSIAAMVVCTTVAARLHLRVETIGSRYGGIPSGLPRIILPTLHASQILPLLPAAMTVALLAAVQSLLSAMVADGLTGTRHNSNVELVAQGIANIASPLFGGIPATGAVARTVTNIRAGAKSPVAGIVHALTLLVLLLVAAPLARFVPLATLAAVLMVVCYKMGEWQDIAAIWRLSWADISVWAATFLLTVLADLTVAVEVGMVLAALLYIHRIAETTTVSMVTEEYIREGRAHVLQDKQVPEHVTILRIHGPFLFGTTDKLLEATADLSGFAATVIVRLRNMTAIDATGMHALEKLAERLKNSGRTLLLCGALDQPARMLEQADFLEHVGRENVLPNIDAALRRAEEIHAGFCGVGRVLT